MPLVKKFNGEGTVLMGEICPITSSGTRISSQDAVLELNAFAEIFHRMVLRHSGNVLQFTGGSALAFWRPSPQAPNHTQPAFAVALELLAETGRVLKKFPYSTQVILGSGKLAGDFFGPTQQFQVIGEAMSICTRISKRIGRQNSSIWMSQYSADLIRPTPDLQVKGTIPRSGLEDLTVYCYQD